MSAHLKTQYLGLALKNPLVVSACPLTGKLETLNRLQDAGAAAVVLPSLFEEQLVHEELEIARLHDFGADAFGEALSYFPELGDYRTGPEEYLRLIEGAKKELDIPVIASLNGTTAGGWAAYAKSMENAGADALELNIYIVASDPELPGAAIEDRYLEILRRVRDEITVPLAVKVGPYFSSFPHIAKQFEKFGARGLVLFNRFLQPDLDLESLQVRPDLVLSQRAELRLSLRWIAMLYGETRLSLAATSGIHESDDLLKAVFAGADVGMLATILLKRGPEHIKSILNGMAEWMEEHDYESVEQLKGSLSQRHAEDPGAFERANYMKALISYTGPYV